MKSSDGPDHAVEITIAPDSYNTEAQMITLYSKTKWMLITVAIMAIATLGAAQHAFARQQTDTRLYLVSVGSGATQTILPCEQ